jgi:hypothetical protein
MLTPARLDSTFDKDIPNHQYIYYTQCILIVPGKRTGNRRETAAIAGMRLLLDHSIWNNHSILVDLLEVLEFSGAFLDNFTYRFPPRVVGGLTLERWGDSSSSGGGVISTFVV